MIKIRLKYLNKQIQNINISGHANYSVAGSDIVCAGVSSLVFSNLMYIQKYDIAKVNIETKQNEIAVRVIEYNQGIEHLLLATIEGLEMIAIEYPKYVKIIKSGGE
ncbi:MAG: ribosomal-processing cysteine protease Prp [Culicoidibacterales bacterium]